MKKGLFILFFCLSSGFVNAQSKSLKSDKMLIAEASCGQCQFKMEGKGCDLAVRINGKSYFVDGILRLKIAMSYVKFVWLLRE